MAWQAVGGAERARRILIQHPHSGEISGVSTYVTNISSELKRMGYEVRIVSSATDSIWDRLRLLSGADHLHLNSHDFVLAAGARFIGVPSSLKYHWPFWLSTKYCYQPVTPTKRLYLEVRYLVNHARRSARPLREATRSFLRLAGRLLTRSFVGSLLACSEFTARALDTSRKVVAVPNPFPMDGLSMVKDRDDAHFVFVGRLAADKGVDLLIEASAELARLYPLLRVTIVGDGPMMPALRQLVQTRQLSDHVSFTGRLSPEAARPIVRRAIALVYPARWEDPAPYPPLEAARDGVVTVGAEVGGLRETAGPHAYLFPVEDAQALRAAMQEVLRDPAQARRRGLKAREHAALVYAAPLAAEALVKTLAFREESESR